MAHQRLQWLRPSPFDRRSALLSQWEIDATLGTWPSICEPTGWRGMPRLVTELHAQFAESAKLEQAINLSAVAFLTFVGLAKKVAKVEANLPARRSAQREGGRGLGYGD